MSFDFGRLGREQKQRFIDQGFLTVEQAVPRVYVNRALRAINHSLGQGRDAGDVKELNARSWCPELGGTPVITDLVNRTPVHQLAEDLIGEDRLCPVTNGQVPPHFPRALDVDASTVKPPTGHIDGIGTSTNGIDEGVYRRFFTGLAVVLLCDLPEGWMGNFTVWPGSHHAVCRHLTEHGHEVLSQGSPRIDWDIEPHMCTGRAGDVIFCHYLTFHSAAPNLSPFVRYAAIFRLRHVEAETNGVAGYSDPWLEYEGLHDLLERSDPAMAS